MCGEKDIVYDYIYRKGGSPPRVRGKGDACKRNGGVKGITPACAGKSHFGLHGCANERDHPRVCGEKHKLAHKPVREGESPPRVRGKDAFQGCLIQTCGITPACAGKSLSYRRMPPRLGDHPRVCGEKGRQASPRSASPGSPPRVRGKVPTKTLSEQLDGITPACAGKRLKRFHSIGHFSCILCLFHSVLHRASVSGGSRAGPCAPPCLPAQNAVPV